MFPLHYERDDRAFSIGGVAVPLSSVNLVRESYAPSGASAPYDQIPKFPLHLDLFGNPFATPKFYNWLQRSCGKSEFKGAREVMLDVFERLIGDEIVPALDLDKDDRLFSFSAGFLRPGHLNLSTIGNCACLGVKVDGHIIDYEEWDTGFAEYEFHNIDFEEQRISLLAGIGHLARIAA